MKRFSKVRGTQPTQPLELEVGKTTVYVRSNIIAINEVDFIGWEYDEIQYTKDEYISLLADKEEVVKLKQENKTLKSELLTTQGAIDFIIMNY